MALIRPVSLTSFKLVFFSASTMSLSAFLNHPVLVKVAKRDPVGRLPAWMMRQTRRPDGVIIFSDILTPLPAFGVEFDIEEVGGHTAILGFVGAPWTIASYIVEGDTTLEEGKTIYSLLSLATIIRELVQGLLKRKSTGYHCLDHVNPAEFLANLISIDYSSADTVYSSQKRLNKVAAASRDMRNALCMCRNAIEMVEEKSGSLPVI
ncbi:hypothetical protein RJT34_12784 [Clitoria ternatea]|uniref:Uroporphyrinogen decarboxylase (URO-D) domain-containing protein n=1 Tax=Clitoria ternatea TaxID=43366 RepID=A0AAN9PLR5_CLITE